MPFASDAELFQTIRKDLYTAVVGDVLEHQADHHRVERGVGERKRVGIRAPLNASVKGLSTAENWLINIARALVRRAPRAGALPDG